MWNSCNSVDVIGFTTGFSLLRDRGYHRVFQAQNGLVESDSGTCWLYKIFVIGSFRWWTPRSRTRCRNRTSSRSTGFCAWAVKSQCSACYSHYIPDTSSWNLQSCFDTKTSRTTHYAVRRGMPIESLHPHPICNWYPDFCFERYLQTQVCLSLGHHV